MRGIHKDTLRLKAVERYCRERIEIVQDVKARHYLKGEIYFSALSRESAFKEVLKVIESRESL